MHLRFNAASAVVFAPLSPQSTAEVFWYPQGLVSHDRAITNYLQWLGVLAGQDDGVGAAVRYGTVAFACVVGPIYISQAKCLLLSPENPFDGEGTFGGSRLGTQSLG